MHLTKRALILWMSLLIGCFLLLSYGVLDHTVWLQKMDQIGQLHLRTTVTQSKTTVLAFITDVLGIYIPILFTVGYVGYLIKQRRFQQMIWYLSSIALSTMVIPTLLKVMINRPRPTPRLVVETTSSFPSGHSTSASFFYWFILFIILRWGAKRLSKLPKWLMGLSTLVIILFVMWTRIYLNVHYLSDVSAGFALGSMEALFFWYIGQRLFFRLSAKQNLVDDSNDVC